MLKNFPFFFTRQEPGPKAEAPEWYQKIGKRMDGAVEKNTQARQAGSDFPHQTSSSKAMPHP